MKVMRLADSLPQPIYSANQVLDNEAKAAQHLGLDLFELMLEAGKASFDVLTQIVDCDSAVLIIAGKGNNGGDGYVAARHCVNAGYKVTLLVLSEQEQLKGDAKRAFEQLSGLSLSVNFEPSLENAVQKINAFEGDLIVDALFGIGFRGALSLTWQNVIEAINSHYASVLSIDVPSGLCATTGHVDSVAVQSHSTITFIAFKQGLLTGKSANYVGDIWLATLGVQEAFVQEVPASFFAQGISGLPNVVPRNPTIHKGSIGLVLALGGNLGMPGAIRMASEAALRSGASLVAVACHEHNQAIVCQGRPELMLAPSNPERLAASSFIEKAKVLLIGPGLGRDSWAQQLVKLAIDSDKTLVVDADALAIVKQANLFNSDWVLTPHPGEAANLLDTDIATIEADRFAAVMAITNKYGGICVLKGAGSLICDGSRVIVNTTGNAGMASGGMGDVLSGIIAALTLQTGSIMDATRLAVSIHGQAAQQVTKQHGMRGLLASDLFEPIRKIVNQY